MRLKNIGFFEKHVEKITLTVAAVAFLVITWLYVFSSPYLVSLRENNQQVTVSPREVEPLVERQAKELQNRIVSNINPLPPINIPDYTKMFKEQLTSHLSEILRLETTLTYPGIDSSQMEFKSAITPIYAVPTVPAPVDLKARSSYGVLADVEDQEHMDSLLALVGTQQPRDFRYVSISAVFNAQQWRQSLRTGEDPRVPPEWYRQTDGAIARVILERQSYDPVTRAWSSEERITLPPSAAVLPDLELRGWTTVEGSDAIRQILGIQEEITHPEFVRLAAGPAWVPPEVESTLDDAQRQRLNEINQRVIRLKSQLMRRQRQDGGVAAPAERMAPEAAPAVAPTPGMPAGGAVRRTTPARTTSSARPAANPNAGGDAQGELETLLAERAQILGGPAAAAPAAAAAGAWGQAPAGNAPVDRRNVGAGRFPVAPAAADPDTAQAEPEADLNQITVWAHDLTAQPGMTYRYRVRVSVLNPLFQKLLNDQQKEEATVLYIDSEASNWSQPITVEPQSRYFLAGSNRQTKSVTVEVYRIFNGSWQVQEFNVGPGQIIGHKVQMSVEDKSLDVDMGVGAVLVDLDFEAPTTRGLARNTVKALIMELNSPMMFARMLDFDYDSDLRKSLQVQAYQARSAATGDASGAMSSSAGNPPSSRTVPVRR